MGISGIGHWLLVAAVVILLFGARRLPDTARDLAKAIKEFKKNLMSEDAPPTITHQATDQHEQERPQSATSSPQRPPSAH